MATELHWRIICLFTSTSHLVIRASWMPDRSENDKMTMPELQASNGYTFDLYRRYIGYRLAARLMLLQSSPSRNGPWTNVKYVVLLDTPPDQSRARGFPRLYRLL